MANQKLVYDDKDFHITAEVVMHNETLSLRFVANKGGKEFAQSIPVQFLANFDKLMFDAVFKHSA